MLDYLPQEEAKLSEWVDRFVTLASTFITELPFKMGDLEQLNEPNLRLKQKQSNLNDAMQRLFASKVEYERATADFERMENEIRVALERKIAAGEDIRRKALNMDDLEALRAADARLRSEQLALSNATESSFLPKAEYEKAKAGYERTQNEIRAVLEAKKAALEEIRRKSYELVEPLRAMPQGNEQFLQMLGIPLGLLERSDRMERLARGERVEPMERPDPIPQRVEKRVEPAEPIHTHTDTPEDFECVAHPGGINLLKWKANSPAGSVYLVSYAIGGWHRGSPTPPTSWNTTAILIPENAQYRKGKQICFPHNSGQQSRTNIAYKVATKYGNKVSQPTEKITVECL